MRIGIGTLGAEAEWTVVVTVVATVVVVVLSRFATCSVSPPHADMQCSSEVDDGPW